MRLLPLSDATMMRAVKTQDNSNDIDLIFDKT